MNVDPGCRPVIAIAIGLAVALPVFVAAIRVRRALILSKRERLAAREDENGRVLLQLADEIDTHATELAHMGQPSARQRAWSRACRRVAIEHLACINALLLEPREGDGLMRDWHGRPPKD